jgi:hypothetical protein
MSMTKKPGSLADLAVKNDSYAFFAQVRKQSPAYPITLPNGAEVYLVTRYADVQAAGSAGIIVSFLYPGACFPEDGIGQVKTALRNLLSRVRAAVLQPPGDSFDK